MNLSRSPGFSSSELASLSAWDLPDISGHTLNSDQLLKSESVDLEDELSPILTVDEIEAMQRQAYDEAYALGKVEGYKAGFDQGFQEGSLKGYDENKTKLEQQSAEFAALMEALSDPFKVLDNEVENELVKLAIGIATQIIRREIKLEPGQIIASVREAINVLPLSSQKIRLFLHPEDAELVRSRLALDEMSTAWAIVEDPLITRGGCKVDTDVSHVDATIESRLAAVVASLLGDERESGSRDVIANELQMSSDIPAEAQGATQGIVVDDCTDAGDISSTAQTARHGAVAEDNPS